MRNLLETHRRSGDGFPLVGGHRGCSCQYQENSLEAMAEGLRRGASYLEIDIQLTKDDVPIVFHDIDVREKTGMQGLVQDHTLQEMRKTFQVPTLREAMQWGRKNHAYFALELKSLPYKTHEQNMRLVSYLDGIVREEGMLEQVEAFGLDFQVLQKLHAIDKQFDIGLIVPFVPADPVRLMKEMDALVYLTYVNELTPDMVHDLQKAGYYVSGAILRDKDLIDYAVSIPTDMFEHDHPEEFQKR